MLNWTGERYVPATSPFEIGADIHYEHIHRYLFARHFVRDKVVLDLACGEGYGSSILAEWAKTVISIDIDSNALQHAMNFYQRKNLNYIEGSLYNIPCISNSFDVIICFEAIEHIQDHLTLMREISRLLSDDGIMIISTPNRIAYSDEPKYSNPFHCHELYFAEFQDLIKQFFCYTNYFGQKVAMGSNIWNFSNNDTDLSHNYFIKFENNRFSAINSDENPLYYLAIASQNELLNIEKMTSFCMDTSHMLRDVKDFQIGQLKNQIIELERTKVDKKNPILEKTYLFIDIGDGFTDSLKIGSVCQYNNYQFQLEFIVDPNVIIKKFRWNLIDCSPCDVTIHNICFITQSHMRYFIHPEDLISNGIKKTKSEFTFISTEPEFIFFNHIMNIVLIKITGSCRTKYNSSQENTP